jgi:hypothetical protein
MTSREAQKLLKKYWKGESTADEEKQLKAFFRIHRRDSLPPDLQQAAELFSFYLKESERTTDDIPLPEIEAEKQDKTRNWVKPWWKYAAVFILILTGLLSYRFAKQQTPKNAPASQYTSQNTSQVFETTQKALQIAAGNLNKGKAEMQKLAYFSEAQQQIAGINHH